MLRDEPGTTVAVTVLGLFREGLLARPYES
jgi:hypothetical protein